MEQSEFSKLILKFKIAYQYFFKYMSKEDIIGLTIMYKEHLSKYDFNTINSAIDKRIENSKYMPTIAEMIEECNSIKNVFLKDVITLMFNDGYFHIGIQKLTDEHALRNYNKILQKLEEGNLYDFFKKDMEEYILKYKQMKLKSEERIKLQ